LVAPLTKKTEATSQRMTALKAFRCSLWMARSCDRSMSNSRAKLPYALARDSALPWPPLADNGSSRASDPMLRRGARPLVTLVGFVISPPAALGVAGHLELISEETSG